MVRDLLPACAQNTRLKVAREAIGTFASKAREYKREKQEVRRHEKQKHKRVAGSFSFISRKF